jgi:hypothetical protein
VQRFCIIGAGACGLAVAKTFAERGIAFDCLEALSDVGGIWNPESPHVVYGSTYLNSSKKLSRYPDFSFPEEWALYVSRAQAQDYLRAYAREFGLYPLIRFNARVTRAEPAEKGWRVTIEGEKAPRNYDGLIVANGHHWEAFTPDYPGNFTGEMLHSHDVKSKEQLKGKRVLVVGAGNSAVDILSDAALEETSRAIHSMRRTYYFFPKTVFGKPTDVFVDYTSRIPLPRSLMRLLYRYGMRIVVGPHRRFGLERPDHNLFEAHPTACNTYLDHIIHGRITVKPGIEKLDGKKVRFVDGSEEEVELPVHGHLTHPRCAKEVEALHPYLPPRARRFLRRRPVRAGGRGRVADRRLSGAADREFLDRPGQGPEARTLVPHAESAGQSRYRPWHQMEGHDLASVRDPALPLPQIHGAAGAALRRLRGQIAGAAHHADRRRACANRGAAQSCVLTRSVAAHFIPPHDGEV